MKSINMFECPVCTVQCKDIDAFTFPACMHTFCKSCLKETFEIKIKEQDITASIFKCIYCSVPFDSSLIKAFVSPQLFTRYCELALELNQIFGLGDDEKMTDCLNEACREKFIIWKDAEYQTCPKCKIKYCRKCFLPFHEQITCEQQKLNFQDKLYKDLKVQLKASRCPSCRVLIEKVSGCNFMTCKCGTYYCHLCDTQLTKADHHPHFEKESPFSNKCKIKVNGNWVSRPAVTAVAKVVDQKVIQQQVIKLNDIPCPQCGCNDPKISKLLLYDKIVHCNSVQCQSQAWCVECKRMVPLQSVLSHFKNMLQCKYK